MLQFQSQFLGKKNELQFNKDHQTNNCVDLFLINFNPQQANILVQR